MDRKIKESEVITSFYLKPVDGKIARFTPGQYITVKLELVEEPYAHLRQYSLSDRPGLDYYRISVKREDPREEGVPAGIVSTALHEKIKQGDQIPITAPAGDFYLNMESKTPVVLISGGVGLMPLMSMLNTMIHEQPEGKVTFIQAAINGKLHAFKEYVKDVSSRHPNVTSYVIYQEPTEPR